ncbi:MAG: hypothetical protein AAGU05_12865 [Anaerolineaceae bacterium]
MDEYAAAVRRAGFGTARFEQNCTHRRNVLLEELHQQLLAFEGRHLDGMIENYQRIRVQVDHKLRTTLSEAVEQTQRASWKFIQKGQPHSYGSLYERDGGMKIGFHRIGLYLVPVKAVRFELAADAELD